jgi:hypothetical protein
MHLVVMTKLAPTHAPRPVSVMGRVLLSNIIKAAYSPTAEEIFASARTCNQRRDFRNAFGRGSFFATYGRRQ